MDPPDMIVVDVRLPGADGYDVVETLRQDSREAATPLVLYSGVNVGDLDVDVADGERQQPLPDEAPSIAEAVTSPESFERQVLGLLRHIVRPHGETAVTDDAGDRAVAGPEPAAAQR